MKNENYTFSKKSFNEIYELLNSDDSVRSRLALMAHKSGIRINDIEEVTERIFTAVASYESVKDPVTSDNIDEVLDRILAECEHRAGLTPVEMLRRLDCCFQVFTDPVKVQLRDSGMTDEEFFAQYSARYGEDIPEENLRASVKNSVNKLDISAYQLSHFLYGLSEGGNAYSEAFSLAEKNFIDKCTVAMKIYLENDNVSVETAAVTACAQSDINSILYAAQRGDIFEKYIVYLIKGIILAAFITVIALAIHYGGFVALLSAIGKFIAKELGITIITNAITGLSVFSGFFSLLAFLSDCPKKIGRSIAYSIYCDSLSSVSKEEFLELSADEESIVQTEESTLEHYNYDETYNTRIHNT